MRFFYVLEKYYSKIAFLNVHDGRIMHRLRCSGIFFDFLGVFHCFSVNIRIEVHLFLFDISASQDLHVTTVLSFPNANKKSVLRSLKKLTLYVVNYMLKCKIHIKWILYSAIALLLH